VTRRTEGVRTHGRSARVVEDVLKATLEEIGRVGYEALRFEDVATLSGVNKTTIYRRWPTKIELVGAALRHLITPNEPPETGSVRGDLLELLREVVKRAESPTGRGLLRMMQNEGSHPEVEQMKRSLHADHVRARAIVVEHAVARGELPPNIDAELVIELAFAPVMRRVVNGIAPADEEFLEAAVDVILAGARAGAATRRPSRSRAFGS
jgi:AcrR family transcriptional regulator